MSPVERQVGRHIIRGEPPDTIFLAIVGDLALEEVHKIHAELEELLRTGTMFFLADISRLGRMSPTARAAGSRWNHLKQARAIGVFGAGFEQRVLATLLLKALRLLTKDFTAPAAFFATEAEARVWVEGLERPA